jgi:hypothetical protein
MKKDRRIVVLHRGWVVVGDVAEPSQPGWFKLTNAAVVRRWGTSKGLGELAESGPLPSSALDPTPDQEFPLSAIINSIQCNAKNWKK